MRKKCFILVIIVMGILLSFSFVSAKELKVFPGELAYDGFGGNNIRFCGFIENSAVFRKSGNLFFTVKKLPKQISAWGIKFWILEANSDEDWILTSDQSQKEKK